MDNDLPLGQVVTRLRQRQILTSGADVEIERLSGGVSAEVFVLSDGQQRLVAKRALARLRVAQEWHASPTRVLVEADAISFARGIRPANVPEVVDVDAEGLVIVMTAAPLDMESWKFRLLNGDIDPAVGRSLGAALADWHSRSSSDPAVLSRFADRTYFFQLRVSPFFQRVAEVNNDLAHKIEAVVERMMQRTVCLVHGDFSPKNVLVGDGSFWVIDWEIAHIGDPAFDLAFLVSHLACKAIHRPGDVARYQSCAEAFLATYLDQSAVHVDQFDMVLQAGCLILARADGKSPADYFDAGDSDAARVLGRWVLEERISDVAALFGPR
jgi:aminoglycoside phosphotransferase (APT) family kinase protein